MKATSAALEVQISHRVHQGLNLDLSIQLGQEIGVLFGPSGAGKSTTLRLIAGLLSPDRGTVRLGDTVLCDASQNIQVPLRQRRIGLIFQDDLLFPHLSVESNIRFGLQGWKRAESYARVREVAELCGIERLLKRFPITLSGGERQRVGLARTLSPRPRLLLCDEPVSALDLDARSALIERIKRVQLAEAIPVLYVTHSPDEAVALGNRLFLLSGGRIIADGSPIDVLSSRGPVESLRLRNVFPALVEAHDDEGRSTILQIMGGPSLVIPKRSEPIGARLLVTIEADEIVLAIGPIGAISARNLIEGTVDRVVEHGQEAEVLVRTSDVVWVVGVVLPTVRALGLIEGSEVRMIIKARSCRVVVGQTG